MMSSNKFLSTTLNTISALTLSLVLLGTVSNPSVWAMEQEDPLFPTTSPGLRQMKAGLELIKKFDAQDTSQETEQRTVRCDTDFRFNDKSFLPKGIVLPKDYEERQSAYTEPNCKIYLGLCLGYGGAKLALKLNPESPTVVLIGPSKIMARKEYEAYEALNAFGLVSQQNPEIVTVAFNNDVTFNLKKAVEFSHHRF